MAFHKLRISSSSHYNEAICRSTVCQFVSFHIINISDVPRWVKYYSQTLMYFIKAGNPPTADFFSGHFGFHLHQRNFCALACTRVHARTHVKYRNRGKGKRGSRALVLAHLRVPTSPRLIIMGWVAINVALISKAFMCGGLRRAAGDLWKLQERWRERAKSAARAPWQDTSHTHAARHVN